MDLFEALTTRRSVRRYLSDPIPDADLSRILEAARFAPSWANTQCWELVIVKDPATKERLRDTLSEANPARQAMIEAPVVIAALGRKGLAGFKKGEARTKHGDWLMFDVALVLHQLSLAAWGLGLGTVHVGLFDHDAAARVIGVPATHELVELMPLGRPAAANTGAPQRKAIDQFVFINRYPSS